MSYQEKTGALMANSHPGSYCGQDAYADLLITESPQRERESMCNDNGNELRNDMGSESGNPCEGLQRPADCVYEARRLTPTECARLQGFPPDWCSDVPHTDAQEYKLWGNGIALPTILGMMRNMRDALLASEDD